MTTPSTQPLTPDELAAIRERLKAHMFSTMRRDQMVVAIAQSRADRFRLLAEVERLNEENADLASLTSAAEEWAVGRMTNLQFVERVEKWQMRRGLRNL